LLACFVGLACQTIPPIVTDCHRGSWFVAGEDGEQMTPRYRDAYVLAFRPDTSGFPTQNEDIFMRLNELESVCAAIGMQ
jgi:hypothetical protein